jgi:hypothetical protein
VADHFCGTHLTGAGRGTVVIDGEVAVFTNIYVVRSMMASSDIQSFLYGIYQEDICAQQLSGTAIMRIMRQNYQTCYSVPRYLARSLQIARLPHSPKVVWTHFPIRYCIKLATVVRTLPFSPSAIFSFAFEIGT